MKKYFIFSASLCSIKLSLEGSYDDQTVCHSDNFFMSNSNSDIFLHEIIRKMPRAQSMRVTLKYDVIL